MKVLSLLLVLLLSSGAVLAQPAISLQPMKGDSALMVVETQNVIGSCGKSIIHVKGISKIMDDYFVIDEGEITVLSAPAKPLVIGEGILSEHNGVACVSTKSGSRLLIWSNCAGSSCGDNFNFYVIDPERLVYLAPKNPRKGLCDAGCASKVLGSNLPQDINNRVNP